MRIKPFLVVVWTSILLAVGTGADWLRFRGPNGAGVADDNRVPTLWSLATRENVPWVADLPGRGISSPIVVQDRVIVTSSSGYRQDRLHVLCVAADDGRKLWERQFWATGRTMTHPSISPAAPTPVCDGQRVITYFSSNDVACLDLDGNLIWLRGLLLDYPNASNSLGLASSPILVADTLVVKIETDSQSLALGLDANSGATRWQLDRPKIGTWTSPVVVGGKEERDAVVLQSAEGLTAHDALTGEELWRFGEGCSSIPSLVAHGSVLYVPSGGLTALRVGGTAAPEVVWKNNRLGPSTATPIVSDGRVYALDGSILKCGLLDSGKLAWQLRLKGNFSGSPVAAGGRLYFFNDEGQGQVVEVSDTEGKTVGGGDLEGTILCTPAIADGAIYVRNDQHLWKISQSPVRVGAQRRSVPQP